VFFFDFAFFLSSSKYITVLYCAVTKRKKKFNQQDCSTCEKGERGRETERKSQSPGLWRRTLARVCLMCERDSRFLGLLGCVYVRGTCGLPPTKTKHVGADRVARVFLFLGACGLRIADAEMADRCVWLCLVGCGVVVCLALQRPHARKLARTH
jgi:hypothetical protein